MERAEEIWRSKTDEELAEAATQLAGFTAEGERVIRAEMTRRGMVDPPPTVRPVEVAPAAESSGLFSEGFFGLLNKGPIGWILFGLLAGIAYGAYQSLQEWLQTLGN